MVALKWGCRLVFVVNNNQVHFRLSSRPRETTVWNLWRQTHWPCTLTIAQLRAARASGTATLDPIFCLIQFTTIIGCPHWLASIVWSTILETAITPYVTWWLKNTVNIQLFVTFLRENQVKKFKFLHSWIFHYRLVRNVYTWFFYLAFDKILTTVNVSSLFVSVNYDYPARK